MLMLSKLKLMLLITIGNLAVMLKWIVMLHVTFERSAQRICWSRLTWVQLLKFRNSIDKDFVAHRIFESSQKSSHSTLSKSLHAALPNRYRNCYNPKQKKIDFSSCDITLLHIAFRRRFCSVVLYSIVVITVEVRRAWEGGENRKGKNEGSQWDVFHIAKLSLFSILLLSLNECLIW